MSREHKKESRGNPMLELSVLLALIDDEDISRMNVRVDHRIAFHADEVRSLWVRAEHTQDVDLLRTFVIVERDREPCDDRNIEGGKLERIDLRGGIDGSDATEIWLGI